MGRASFGGQQDISGYLADLYNRYENELESLAERAADRADREQQALDNDTIDRWQQGEMTDAEFLAFVQQRLAESAGEAEEETYWKKVLRDTEKSMLSEQISDTAESIINDINAGRKTYGDLLAFYKAQQSKLRPSDPLYDELKDQIEQVNDQIAENKISGALAKVDYQFRAGQITGTQAGAQMRALAAQYKASDPAKYYQLLSNALEYEQYAGTYSAGGGGGGRRSSGGGGGGSTTNINNTIDALQGLEDRLGSLSEQFEAGERVGTITFEDANGKLVTEEVELMKPDGTPTRSMIAADNEMLNVLDELEAAYIEKGDRSAAGEVSNRRAQFITDHVQPRNTITSENQANRLLASLQATVEAAAESPDPVLAWRKVQAAAARVSAWHRRLNKKSTVEFTGKVDEKKQRENPELGAANRREVLTDDAARDRTTAEFTTRADALLAYAQTIARAKDAAGLAGVGDLLVGMGFTETQAEGMVERTAAVVDLVTGIPAGNYVRVFIPGQGLVFTPVGETTSATVGPDGSIVTRPRRMPIGPDANPLVDESAGQRLQLIHAEINGQIEPIYGIAEQVYMIGNEQVSQADYDQFVRRIQTLQESEKRTAADESELALLEAAGAPRAFRQALAPRADGKAGAVTWLQDETGMWFKNRVPAKGRNGTSGGGVPFIFSGKNARAVQAIASTEINPETGQVWDPTGRAFFNERDYQQKRSTNVLEGDGSDWYEVGERGKSEELKARERQALADQLKAGRNFGPQQDGMFSGRAGKIISQSAQQLGINLGAPSTRQEFAGRKHSGFQSGIDGKLATPRVSIRPPSVNLTPIRPAGRGFGATVDTAGIRNRLAGIRTRRRTGSLSKSGSRETYAGLGFSGFQR